MRIFGFILLGVATLVVILYLSVYGFGTFQRETAEFRGETGVIEDTQADSSYRIAAYERFFSKCSAIQTLESRVINMEEELEMTEGEQRRTVLVSSITAAKNQRSELINSYNADARQEGTVGQFRSSDLPYELNESEEKTTCEAQ